MKIVFLQEVEGSGHVGEVKEVKNGYARNYLLPLGLAAPATKAVMQRVVKLAKVDAVRQEKADAASQGIAQRLDGAEIALHARVGEQGRLFGSITAADIAARASDLAGETIEHRQVLLGQPIRTLGTQAVRVRFTRNVSATVQVTVEAMEEERRGARAAATATDTATDAATEMSEAGGEAAEPDQEHT